MPKKVNELTAATTVADSDLVIVANPSTGAMKKATVSQISGSNSSVNLVDGSTIAWDYTAGNIAAVTIAGNRTLNMTNVPAGAFGILLVKQDSIGGRTLALPGNKESGFTLSSGANQEDMIGFFYNGTVFYWSISNYGTVTGGGDITAPTVTGSVTLSPTQIRLTFSEIVNSTVAGFTFRKNSSNLITSAVSGSGTTQLTFTVDSMANGDVLDFSYNPAIGSCLDNAGNELAAVTNSSVTNTIPAGDTTAPVVTSRKVTGSNTVRVILSESVTATIFGWIVRKNGVTNTITGLTGSGSNTIDLTVTTALEETDTVTLSYDQSSGSTQDAAGNEVVAFTNVLVGKASDTTAPTISSIGAISNTEIAVQFSEPVFISLAGWSFTKNSAAHNPIGLSGTGTSTVIFTVPSMSTEDVLTATYQQSLGNTKDASDNFLANQSGISVANNIPSNVEYVSWYQIETTQNEVFNSGKSLRRVTSPNTSLQGVTYSQQVFAKGKEVVLILPPDDMASYTLNAQMRPNRVGEWDSGSTINIRVAGGSGTAYSGTTSQGTFTYTQSNHLKIRYELDGTVKVQKSANNGISWTDVHTYSALADVTYYLGIGPSSFKDVAGNGISFLEIKIQDLT